MVHVLEVQAEPPSHGPWPRFFRIPVEAESAEVACEKTQDQHLRTRVVLIRDTLPQCVNRLNHLAAYPRDEDDRRRWDQLLPQFQSLIAQDEPEPLLVIRALILCSDPRVIDREQVCAIWEQNNRWWIFGAT